MTILSETIKRLHLRPNAPYPSEELRAKQAEKEAHEAIRKWRESTRLHLVKDDMKPLNFQPQNWHDRSQIGWNHDRNHYLRSRGGPRSDRFYNL